MNGLATFRLLGPVAALDPDGNPLPLGGPRRRSVLAALLLHRGRTLSVERLVTMLWPDPAPATAPTMVHGAVAAIRRVLAPSGQARMLVTRDGGYRLDVPAEQVDAARFERALAVGRDALGTSPQRASAILAAALAEWRGPALAGVEELFAQSAAARLDEMRLRCHELWAAAELHRGGHDVVVAELEELVAAHPLREELCAHLIVALYRCGRQVDALAAYRRLHTTLVAELGVEPGRRLRDLEAAVLRQERSLLAAATLPVPIGSFVGRERELDDVGHLLEAHRLVTLTGPGGAGKTRLALEVVRRLAYGETVLVDLAPLGATPGLVVETVAEALGVRAEPGLPLARTVAAALSARPAVVVLDNCEHVVAACAELVQVMLAGAAGLRVLATSRERLGVPGERVHPVPPLRTWAGEGWKRAAASEAVQLFAARAAAARPGFAVTAGNASVVAEICRRLDGLPLAIELAAARSATLPLPEVARRLDNRFALLEAVTRAADPRHRSLAATLVWSYDLLTGQEQTAFARLATFPAGFDLDAASAVCGRPCDIAVPLARLVAASLVQFDNGPDGVRYRMLESIRAYAGQLLDGPMRNALDERHADHYLALAQEAQPRLFCAGSGRWLERLHVERDNLRAALAWSFSADPERGVRLVECLWHYWDLRGERDEGLHWVHVALAAVGADRPDRRLPLLSAGALLHVGRTDLTRTTRLASEQLGLARRWGDRRWEGDALALLATVDWARGRFDRAQQRYEDAVGASLAGNDLWRAAMEEAQLARLHRDRREPDAARAVALRSLGHAEEVGEALARGLALDVLASVEHRWGDETLASRLVGDALAHYRSVRYREGEASALCLAGAIALRAGQDADGREAFRAALRLCRRIGHRAGTAAALEGLAAASAAPDEATALAVEASSLRTEIGVPRLADD